MSPQGPLSTRHPGTCCCELPCSEGGQARPLCTPREAPAPSWLRHGADTTQVPAPGASRPAPACSAPTPTRGQVLRGRPCPRAGATGGCSVGGRVCVGEGASLGRTPPLSQAPAPLTRAPPLRATGSRPVALVATVTSEPAGPRARPAVTAQGPSPRGARGQAPAPLRRPRSGAPGGLPTPEEGTGNRRGLRGDLQRRRRRRHGSDEGRRRGEETRGGDAAISVPGSGSPQRAKATERAQAGTPGRHPGTSPARSDADFTWPRPPPRTSCAGGRLRAGGPRP